MIDEKFFVVIPILLNFQKPAGFQEQEAETNLVEFATPLTQQRVVMCITQYF